MLKQIDFTMNTGLKYHMFFDDEYMTEEQALVECEFVGWGAGHDHSLYPYYIIVPEGKEPILKTIVKHWRENKEEEDEEIDEEEEESEGDEEEVDVFIGKDRKTGQVDGGEAQIAAAGSHFAGGIVHVAHDAGTAAHVGDFGFGMAFLVVLQVVGGVDEGEVGEEALGAGLDGQAVQVVVGIAGVEVDAFLHAEDLDGEDGGLAAAQAVLGGVEQVLHHHAAFGRGVHTIVDGGEGHLRAGAAVHGVEVVDEGFHGLIGGLVGFGMGVGAHEIDDAGGGGLVAGDGCDQLGGKGGVVSSIFGQMGLTHAFLLQLGKQLTGNGVGILQTAQQLHGAHQVVAETLEVGLLHAGSHAVVEVDHALAAVLIVLVGLNGNAGQRGVAVDVVGLAQHAVTGGEAVVEQIQQVNLAAGGGEGVEVQIVDVDVALAVRLGEAGIQHIHIVELLGALAAELEHAAHGGIAVDVGVFALDVAVHGILIGDVLENLHQAGVHFAHAAALGPVEDVGLGRADEALFDEHLFNGILHLLHGGGGFHGLIPFDGIHNQLCQFLGGIGALAAAAGHEGFLDGLFDLLLLEGNHAAVAFGDGGNHDDPAPLYQESQ